MNIKRAKQEIKDTIEAYLLKDEYGEYVIPQIRQRPVLLLGAPGIGKTQIMEQIAQGVPSRACLLYNHASYETECDRPAVYFKKGVMAAKSIP